MFDELPKGHFSAVLADPPWKFKTYNEKGRSRCPDWKPFKGSPSIHYDTLSTEEMAQWPVADLMKPDACLFLWICWPLLDDGLDLMRAWGFTYKTCAFSWMKADVSTVDMFDAPKDVQIGTGYWTRSNSEVCLLGTRGHPQRLDAGVPQGFIERRREHSRKPDGVHERIERLVAGPYLELFARRRHPTWTAWGNQVDKFRAAEVL